MRKLAGMIQRWRLIICIPDPHPKICTQRATNGRGDPAGRPQCILIYVLKGNVYAHPTLERDSLSSRALENPRPSLRGTGIQELGSPNRPCS